MRKKVVSITVALIFAMTPMSAMAANSDDIQQDIDATEEELSQAKSEEEETLESQRELQEEIDEINAEITDLNDENESLENVTIREAISDMRLEFVHFLKNIFSSDSENKKLTRREQIEENTDQLEILQTELEVASEELDENTQLATDAETRQTDLAKQLDSLQEKYEQAIAQEEADRVAAEEEEARIAAEEEADRVAAEEEADRIAAEEEAQRIAAQEEAARIAEEEADAQADSSGEIAPVEAATTDSYIMPSGDGILTWLGGVNYFDGHKETWYTMREWTGDLGIPGMYIGIDGIVRDCDNYICVASDDDPKGTVLETSLGTAKVYDCGPGHGIIDIYTDWPLY